VLDVALTAFLATVSSPVITHFMLALCSAVSTLFAFASTARRIARPSGVDTASAQRRQPPLRNDREREYPGQNDEETHPQATLSEHDDVRPEYRFEHAQAKPNRFASRMTRPVVAVVLESDVAAVFDSSAKVNAQLRSAIATGKRRKQAPRTRPRHRRAN
jgi:hypothetical protein